MQLSRYRRGVAIALSLGMLGAAVASRLEADSAFSTTNTFFLEFGGPLRMMVVTPGANLKLDLGEHLTISGGWEADIVSGASVAVVDAPAPTIDALTVASVYDFRNVGRGRIELRDGATTLRGGYTYGIENDYRSHAFDVSARTELFERNTAFELSYARGFDSVCDLAQPRAQEAVNRQRLPTSDGCFSSGATDRDTRDVSLQTFQGSWSQAWTRILATQLTFTTQIVDGFQSNPYRAVWLGRAAAQEHHPRLRVRYAVGLGTRLWVAPLRGALQLDLRGYRDTWDILSLTAELAYDWAPIDGLRVRVRGRYYKQTAAIFFSDDYGRLPAGSYFTGDRELSDMSSFTVGGRFAWSISPNDEGRVLGFLSSLDLVLKGDLMMFDFASFRYGQFAVPNDRAIVATLSLEAGF
jgi:hypothetical protein